MLRRHVLLLSLHKAELPLIPVPLRVELVPFPRLLHQHRLQLRWRRRDAVRRLHCGWWRGRRHPRSTNRRSRRGKWRRRRWRRPVVPHRSFSSPLSVRQSGAKPWGSSEQGFLGFGISNPLGELERE